jgi:hypothetical protein
VPTDPADQPRLSLRPKRLLRHWVLFFLGVLLAAMGGACLAEGHLLLAATAAVIALQSIVHWALPDRLTLTLRKTYEPGGQPLFCYRVTEGEEVHLYIATDDLHLCWLTEYDGVGKGATVENLGEVRY